MKNVYAFFSCIVIISACKNNTANKPKTDTTPATSQTNNSVDILVDTLGNHTNPADLKFEKGRSLVTKSDCLGCHKVKEKSIGPDYVSIADKYASTDEYISYISSKIIKGGGGVWGEVPMTPHPQIGKDDANEMAKYILSFKGISK